MDCVYALASASSTARGVFGRWLSGLEGFVETIEILVFEDVEELDFVGPLEVFGTAARLGADCQVTITSEDGKPVRGRNGLKIIPDCPFDSLPPPAMLIVPGGLGARTHARANPRILQLVRAQTGIVASVCTGALILAAAGVLDNRPATTHHSAFDMLREYGRISVRENERWTIEGTIATSAGVSAGIDLALALVRSNWGAATAEAVADHMEWNRTQ
jgi:transcriptional regulator GlxA family with amidase domain